MNPRKIMPIGHKIIHLFSSSLMIRWERSKPGFCACQAPARLLSNNHQPWIHQTLRVTYSIIINCKILEILFMLPDGVGSPSVCCGSGASYNSLPFSGTLKTQKLYKKIILYGMSLFCVWVSSSVIQLIFWDGVFHWSRGSSIKVVWLDIKSPENPPVSASPSTGIMP